MKAFFSRTNFIIRNVIRNFLEYYSLFKAFIVKYIYIKVKDNYMKKILLLISVSLLAIFLYSCDEIIVDDIKEEIYLSTIYINVEDSKDVLRDKWNNASISIESKDEFNFESSALRVRGRGNSTWYSVPEEFPKRPYRIRFDEETSILGMKPAKDFVFLAELYDRSLLRNYLAHRMSEDLNLYSLETRPIELYLNDEYQGFYLLTEQVEVYETRLNIDTSTPTGGFLIEMEADERVHEEGLENVHWVRVRDKNYVIKDPDMDDLSELEALEKTTFIKNYLNNVYNSLNSNNYNEYVEINSFIDYFVLNEISKQIDINWSSVYSHRNGEGKLQMGPIWDFDLAFGNTNYGEKFNIPFESPTGFWMPGHQWFDRAMENETFKTLYISRFKEVLNTYFDDWMADLGDMFILINEAGNRNFERWPILDFYMWPINDKTLAANSHAEHFIILKDYLTNRRIWILSNIDSFY